MPDLVRPEDLWLLEPGTVLSVRFPGGIEHFGLLTEEHEFGGSPTIISASKIRRAVVEESPTEFSFGLAIYAHRRWGTQSWEDTLEIARANLGYPYHPFNANCEHFVRFCSGLRPESPQLVKAFGAALVGGAAFCIVAAIANS